MRPLLRIAASASQRACRPCTGVNRAAAPLRTPVSQRRFYWKVGAGDKYFESLLDLEHEPILQLMDDTPDDPDKLAYGLTALWSLAKVEEPSRQTMLNDACVVAKLKHCLEVALSHNHEELASMVVQFLNMCEHDFGSTAPELVGPLKKCSETFQNCAELKEAAPALPA
ncbi:hypothetical protein DIPPA_20715 [Diplonema papillatum]|nr:hypothetical protein DIPPA_20715 [Diplonema papillatum]|eukprot:gene20027-30823_t